MKVFSLPSLLVVSALTVVAIGCAKTSSDNSSDQAYKFPYNLKAGSCETGPQNPTSAEETCRLLKDDAANNDCAKEQRENIFNDRCTGGKGTTTVKTEVTAEDPAPKGGDLSKLMRTRVLTDGNQFTEAIKLVANNTEGEKSSISGLLTTVCAKDIESALALKVNGVILFDLGKMAMNDDKESLSHQEKSEQATVLIDCIGNASLKAAAVLKTKVSESDKYEIKNMKLGTGEKETIKLSQEGDAKASSVIAVYCIGDEATSVLSGNNGLQLKAGARILLKRDLELAALKKIAGEKEKVVITCGLE